MKRLVKEEERCACQEGEEARHTGHGAGTQRSHCRGAWLLNGKVTQGLFVLRQLHKPLLPEEPLPLSVRLQPLQGPQKPSVGTAFHLFLD